MKSSRALKFSLSLTHFHPHPPSHPRPHPHPHPHPHSPPPTLASTNARPWSNLKAPKKLKTLFAQISFHNSQLTVSRTKENVTSEIIDDGSKFIAPQHPPPFIFIRYNDGAEISHLLKHLKGSIQPGLALCRQNFPNNDGYVLYTLEKIRGVLQIPEPIRDTLRTKSLANSILDAEDFVTTLMHMTFSPLDPQNFFIPKMSMIYTFLWIKLCSFRVEVMQEDSARIPAAELHLRPELMMAAMPTRTNYLTTPHTQGSSRTWTWCPMPLDSSGEISNLANPEFEKHRVLVLRKTLKKEAQVAHREDSAERKMGRTRERMKRRGTWLPLVAGSITRHPALLQKMLKGTEYEQYLDT